jgi:hypothetical protein
VESEHVLTKRQLDILQHALGVDQYGQGKMYRNHFCAGGGDEQVCRELVSLGYMWEWHKSYQEMFPYYNCSVTQAGKTAMLAASPAPPKLTRSQKRYRAFLRADADRTFGEWLKDQSEAMDAN